MPTGRARVAAPADDKFAALVWSRRQRGLRSAASAARAVAPRPCAVRRGCGLGSAMSAQYSATLTSFHTASPDKDPYTIYVITVKRGAQQWQVFRRYREVLPQGIPSHVARYH